jgi:hypothetical protein
MDTVHTVTTTVVQYNILIMDGMVAMPLSSRVNTVVSDCLNIHNMLVYMVMTRNDIGVWIWIHGGAIKRDLFPCSSSGGTLTWFHMKKPATRSGYIIGW